MNYWLISIFSLIGLLDVGFIHYKKTNNNKLVCVIGKDCNAVLESKYNSFLGIPITIWGGLYYLGMLVLAILCLGQVVSLFGVQLIYVLKLLSALAALGSVSLIFIQLVVLKEWCEYCLLSAVVNFLLLITIW